MMLQFSQIKLSNSFRNCLYRLMIFRKPLLFTILSKNLNGNSPYQYYYEKKVIKFFRKMVNKRGFLKINLKSGQIGNSKKKLITLVKNLWSINLNLVKSWCCSFSCIVLMSGKSPGDIWCSLWICPYRLSKFLMSSFFLASLPNMEGISFFRPDMM